MQPIICACCVVYGTVAEREVVVVADESGVVFLAGRSELVVQRISSLYIGGSPCSFGMTLLSFTDGAADFAVRSRRLTSLLTSSAVASAMVSVVPPTMTISVDRVCISGLVDHLFNLFELGSRFFDNTYLASIARAVEVDITQ